MYSSYLLALLFIRASLAFNCSLSPIYIDIHKRAVHGTETFEYGTFVGFGSPAQNQSLWPSLSQNETSVASPTFCQGSNLTNCSDSTGGVYETDQSSTWTFDKSYQSNDLNNDPSTGSFGSDIIHLYTHFFETDPASETKITNFPVQLINNGSSDPGLMGFGTESTLLTKLYDAGAISSRSLSLYLGTGYDRAGGVINGSVTIGGYDAGRFNGTVHNYTLDETQTNPFSVHVSRITLNDPTGLVRNVDLVDGNGFDAIITTDQYPFALPFDVTQNFVNALAAVPANNFDDSLKITKPFNGTLTITLSDGFAVTLPPWVVANVSGLSPVQQQTSNSTGPHYLGGAWLSYVYLMMNYDDNFFHLARAIPEANFVIMNTMCPKIVPTPYIQPSSGGFANTGLIGAVVGGVIGGSALTTLAICVCLAWGRKRKEEKIGVKVGFAEYELERDGSPKPKKWKKLGKAALEAQDHEMRFWKAIKKPS